MQLVFRSILFVLVSSCFVVVNAAQLNDSSHLQNMDHELNQHPWETYQSLLTQESELDSMSAHYKLWWLLRKAQSENLIFFLSDFKKTVEQAHSLVSQQTPARLVINLNIFRGIILQRDGRYQESQLTLKKAMKSALENDYTYLAVEAKQELAYTRSLTEVYELSLTELQQAYVEAFSLNNEFLIAKINEVYGAIYGYMDDYDKSIEYYRKALTSYQLLAYPAYEAEAIHGMAATYRYWEKYDLAIEYYQRYRKAIEYSPKNIDGKFYAAYGIAMSEAGKGNCNKALVSIDFASGLEGLIDYKAELYKRKSDCLITLNKLAQARVSLEKANDIFKKIPELTGTRWQIETLKIGAELAKAEGNYEIAYQLFNQFHYDEVDMLRRNMTDRLLRVRGTLESERQNVEISLLKQRAKVQKLQFEQQKQDNTIQSYIIGLIVLFIFFMLFFAYFQWSHNKKLTLLSIRDPLSNSFNRRYVFNFLHKLVSANHSDRNTISIMVIDIDDFKKVNDVYGHPFGDEVIRKIAEIGSEVLRTEDVIGRVGGEEFLCVLPRIDAVQSLHIAQRFVNRVNAYDFFSEDEEEKIQKVNVTVSIGLATTSKHIQSSSELYVQADKALYHAKYNGKNRAIQYQDAMQYSNQQKANFSHATSILDDE